MTNCILCQSQTVEFKHPKTGMSFHQCPTCQIIFKDQTAWPSSEDEKSRYLEHHNDITQKGYVNFLQNFIDQSIVPYIQKGDLLDFGSGPGGVMSTLLHAMGYKVDSYDPFFQPNLPDKTYDLILATEVMEHIHDPLQALQWINSHLKKNGYFSLMTLFYPSDRNQFFDWFYIRDITHVVFYSPATLKFIAKYMRWQLISHNSHRFATFQKK